MTLIEFIGQMLDQVDEETQVSLDGMTLEQILWRPTEEANSMAWLAWHIARTQDLRSSHLLERHQSRSDEPNQQYAGCAGALDQYRDQGTDDQSCHSVARNPI